MKQTEQRSDPTRRRRKRSEEVAERIVALIMRLDLPFGVKLWTEREAMRTLGVSRGTLREAVRQLEWQGAVSMRQGAGGGLCTSAPRAFVPMYALKRYFELTGVDARTLLRSFRLLQSTVDAPDRPQENDILSIFTQAVDGRFTALHETTDDPLRTTRLAETTAVRINLLLKAGGLGAGASIGNEASFIRRFGVGRGVMREALRLMELAGLIEVRRGVSGGIFVDRPSPDFIVYVFCVYLALARIPLGSVVAAQLKILRVLLRQSAPERTAAAFDLLAQRSWDLEELAVAGARVASAEELLPIEIVMAVFSCFWRDFRPEARHLSSDHGGEPDDGETGLRDHITADVRLEIAALIASAANARADQDKDLQHTGDIAGAARP